MDNYERFAQFYDAVMGDRAESTRELMAFIQTHTPHARKVLELACGTGAVLQHLEQNYEISGLDLSSEMLEIAKKKIPGLKSYHQDMTEFQIPETFDVVFCVFDSINHVLDFAGWEKMFGNAAHHLSDGGVFIFDINTEKKLSRHASEPAWIHAFGNNFLIMTVTSAGKDITNWNIKIFELEIQNRYLLHEQDIKEISFPEEKITSALRKYFGKITVVDTDKDDPKHGGDRLYFICKKSEGFGGCK